ncbi:hypothetical protein [Solirubrum puertoriconensis]|uniref:hypothetical protein n=1 Tax=Solirubrum puertoriconensis TaxID=1751427 RepID=UPI00122E4FF7|nr:hypothetical protein [Solirubrum puertoriconensis]
MDRKHPSSIIEAQFLNGYKIESKEFNRIPFGEEEIFISGALIPKDTCGDCGVKEGMYHTFRCDQEQCPKCGWQVLTCECDIEENIEIVEATDLKEASSET